MKFSNYRLPLLQSFPIRLPEFLYEVTAAVIIDHYLDCEKVLATAKFTN